MHSILVAWTVLAMIGAQPKAVTPWASSYESTAEAFVTVAEEAPLHDPARDGVRQTIADFLGVSWFESRFDPKAKGDGACIKKDEAGKCLVKGPPNSFCAFQINRSNFVYLKVTEEELLTDILACTRAARKMMRQSMNACRGRPADEWLSWYAAGGSCDRGLKESRHRFAKSAWIYSHVPFTDDSKNAKTE